ncbi:MAG: zf-TFIIB domain-containing protein [Acidobacteria bacterium]|nr:zf-TFIIB domain-containing protein [Acidobacteriota bacterium]
MNCPSCGAPLHLEPEQDHCLCGYCGGVYYPEQNEEGVRVFGEAASGACPLCAVPLMHAAIGGARILYCGRCRGMLIPMEIFGGLTDELRAQLGSRGLIPRPPDARELDRHIACPQCGEGMDAHRYGGPGNIVIDSCEKCHVNWLDPGELMRVARTPDHWIPAESDPG